MSLTITTITGSREVQAYRVRNDPHNLHARAETNSGNRVVVLGDRGLVPTPLEVEVSIQEASLAASVALANAVLADAEAATSVTTYRETRTVDGLIDHRMRADGPLVRLTLFFAPVDGSVGSGLLAPPEDDTGDEDTGSDDGGDTGSGDDGDTGDAGSVTLAGSGSTSTSLVGYPKTGSVTTGDYYVDPTASTNGTGTEANPFDNLDDALSAVSDGQTILVKAGTLTPTSRWVRSQTWATGIKVFNYGTDRPTIDASLIADPSSSGGRVITLTGSNEHWKGFTVTGGDSLSGVIYVDGSNYTLEDLHAYENQSSPFYLYGASNCTLKDCAAWKSGDGSSMGTGTPDQFVATGMADSNTFVRCFAAHGPDDNYDFIAGTNNTVIDCVSYEAGYYWNGNAGGSSAGDGNGFKGGGSAPSGDGGNNAYSGCVSVKSRSSNFSHNQSPVGGITFDYCTSHDSGYVGMDAGSDGTNDITNSISHVASEHLFYIDGAASTPSGCFAGDPSFADVAGGDYSIQSGSSAEGLGASTVALELTMEWLSKDLS